MIVNVDNQTSYGMRRMHFEMKQGQWLKLGGPVISAGSAVQFCAANWAWFNGTSALVKFRIMGELVSIIDDY